MARLALGVIVLGILPACHEEIMPPAAVDVKPVASSKTPPAPASAACPQMTEELKGIATDGPYPSLGAYCTWFKRDCTPHDARMCQCDVEQSGPTLAIVRTRDLGREGANGMNTDFMAIRPAFRRSDGWRVASVAPEYSEGAEVGGVDPFRTRARLERAVNVDVFDDEAAESVFSLVVVDDQMARGAKTWTAQSTTGIVVVCGDTNGGFCTAPLLRSDTVPTLHKGENGCVIVDHPKSGRPAFVRIVVAPRAP